MLIALLAVVAHGKMNHLMSATCDNQVIMFGQNDLRTVMEWPNYMENVMTFVKDEINARIRKYCPDVTQEYLEGFFPGLSGDFGSFLRYLDSAFTEKSILALCPPGIMDRDMGNFFATALTLPSTCTYKNWRATGKCDFQVDLGSDSRILFSARRCASSTPGKSNWPKVDVSCAGPDCDKLLSPCMADSECGKMTCLRLGDYALFNSPSTAKCGAKGDGVKYNESQVDVPVMTRGETVIAQAETFCSRDRCGEPCLHALTFGDRKCASDPAWAGVVPDNPSCLDPKSGSGAHTMEIYRFLFGKDMANLYPDAPADYGKTFINNLVNKAAQLISGTSGGANYVSKHGIFDGGFCAPNLEYSDKMGCSVTETPYVNNYCGTACYTETSVGFFQFRDYFEANQTNCKPQYPSDCDRVRPRRPIQCSWLKPSTEAALSLTRDDQNRFTSRGEFAIELGCDGKWTLDLGFSKGRSARLQTPVGRVLEIALGELKNILILRGRGLADKVMTHFWPLSLKWWGNFLDDSAVRPNTDVAGGSPLEKIYSLMTRSECRDFYEFQDVNSWSDSFNRLNSSDPDLCSNPVAQQLNRWFWQCGSKCEQHLNACGSMFQSLNGSPFASKCFQPWTDSMKLQNPAFIQPVFSASQTQTYDHIPKLAGLPTSCDVTSLKAGKCSFKMALDQLWLPSSAGEVRVQLDTCTNGWLHMVATVTGEVTKKLAEPFGQTCDPNLPNSCGAGAECAEVGGAEDPEDIILNGNYAYVPCTGTDSSKCPTHDRDGPTCCIKNVCGYTYYTPSGPGCSPYTHSFAQTRASPPAPSTFLRDLFYRIANLPSPPATDTKRGICMSIININKNWFDGSFKTSQGPPKTTTLTGFSAMAATDMPAAVIVNNPAPRGTIGGVDNPIPTPTPKPTPATTSDATPLSFSVLTGLALASGLSVAF